VDTPSEFHSILHKEAFDHYSLLIKSLHMLLKTEIIENDLTQCEYLIKFVGYYEIYYEAKYITFNVHTLLHIVESVKKTDPL